jgi:hypothetical protein
LFTSGTSWGTSSVAQANTSEVKKDASPIKKAKTVKKDQSGGKLDPDHPSAVSQDMEKNILDAAMAANPNALGHVLQKSLQSMVMLKMMDKVTSPAGILSMASGGMGGALQGLAAGVGISPMLGALNGVMPALSVSGLLNGTGTDTLHNGMMGMLDNVAVGALAASEIASAVSSASTISEAMGAIIDGAADALDAVAAFGGPAFGLTPGSLAAKIALVGPSGRVNTTVSCGGILVNATIITSQNPHLTQRIPVLTGMEHIEIATAAVSDITGVLSDVLGVNNVVGDILGTVSDVTGGISDLAGAFSNISSFTPGALGGIVNGGIDGVIDGGLTKILGFPMSGLMANVSSLLPGIGGSITSSLSGLGSINGIGSASALGIRIQNGVVSINGIGTVDAVAIRIQNAQGAVIGVGTITGLGGILASANGSIVGIGTVDANGNAILAGNSSITGIASIIVIGYRIGEEWSNSAVGSNTWTAASVTGNNWTDKTADSNTWTASNVSSNTWTDKTTGSNTWLPQ